MVILSRYIWNKYNSGIYEFHECYSYMSTTYSSRYITQTRNIDNNASYTQAKHGRIQAWFYTGTFSATHRKETMYQLNIHCDFLMELIFLIFVLSGILCTHIK